MVWISGGSPSSRLSRAIVDGSGEGVGVLLPGLHEELLGSYEDCYNTQRPHRTLKQAAPLRLLPDCLTDLDRFRVQRRDRAGGVIHEYRLVA